MKSRMTFSHLLRTLLVMALDFLIMLCSYSVARWIRFDFDVELFMPSGNGWLASLITACAALCLFFGLGFYRVMWRYISARDTFIIATGVTLANIIPVIFYFAGWYLTENGRSTFLIAWAFQLVFIIGNRWAYRIIRTMPVYWRAAKTNSDKRRKRTMILGAGEAGRLLIRETHANGKLDINPVCLIDDNVNLIGGRIENVPVVGTRFDIESAVRHYKVEQIIFAIPSADSEQRRAMLEICNRTGCILKAMPGIFEMVSRHSAKTEIRQVEIEDLLGRDPVTLNREAVAAWVNGKTVLVTGGGGSIGSELCRQIAGYSPKKLVILDVYENNAYAIEQELRRSQPDLDFDTVIASVRETDRINQIMLTYHPDIVFHAAAHKHVPLMENSPNEAIKNNVFGTLKTAEAAIRAGVEKFVLISTDKAVNPTNIMGASKRLCEMVIQSMNGRSNTDFAAVRFGNVLGSNGSVIPLFKKQIAEGGPVTVTHPEIIRYFMTIPEAVSLVMEAGAKAHGGEIFVLDMGKPVRIDDLARNLIRLSGYTPDVDIKIEYTGLRPGEKLFEEMLMSEEGLRQTDSKNIFIGNPIPMDDEDFRANLDALKNACYHNVSDIKARVAAMVPTYRPMAESVTPETITEHKEEVHA